jgi:tRNA threonylcarbamoyladenosine biosynthesis protein TsaB
MITLGIDTSGSEGGVALRKNAELLMEISMKTPLQHAEELLPLIDEALDHCKMTISEVGLVSVNTGPGSFTGLRIGLATAKGICHASGIPLVGIDGWRIFRDGLSFDGNAYECVVIENRRDLHYVKWFHGDKPLRKAEVLTGDQVVEMVFAEKRPVSVFGNSIPALRGRLAEREGPHVSVYQMDRQVSSVVACLGAEVYSQDQLYELEPIYVEPVLAKINY